MLFSERSCSALARPHAYKLGISRVGYAVLVALCAPVLMADTVLPLGNTVFSANDEALGALTRSTGATASFTGTGITASAATPNSILGPWATTGTGSSTRYATLSSGVVSAFTSGTSANFGWASGNNNTFNYDVTGPGGGGNVLGVNRQANTARYTGGAVTQFWGNNNTTTITLNGLMNAGSGVLTFSQNGGANQGRLVVGTNNGNELVLHAANAGINISIPIIDGSGAGAVTVVGPNTVTFNAANTFTGALTVTNGATLAITAANTVANVVSGSGAINSAASTTVTGNFTGFSGTYTHNSTTASTSFNLAAATSGNAAYHIASSQGSSQGMIAGGSGDYTLEIGALSGVADSLFRGGNVATGTTTLRIGNLNTNTVFSGSINNGATKTLALTKVGTGSLTIGGASTYTGATSVEGGALIVNSSLASTSVNVAATSGTATLGGVGTIAGATAVGSNGILSPGNSPGVLTFSNNLTLNSGSTSLFEINGVTRGTEHDGVNVGGALVYGGTHSVSFGATIQQGTYNLFDFTSQSGSFSAVSIGGSFAETLIGSPSVGASGWSALSASWSYVFDNASGDLTISAIPEPSSFAILASIGALGYVATGRRRRVTA